MLTRWSYPICKAKFQEVEELNWESIIQNHNRKSLIVKFIYFQYALKRCFSMTSSMSPHEEMNFGQV